MFTNALKILKVCYFLILMTFFVSGFYCINVIGSMYYKIDTLQAIILMWKSFICSMGGIYFYYFHCVNLF